jgi:plastocyanin
MRFYGIALLAGAAVLGACGGENKSATDTAAANAAAMSTATPSTPATPSTATPAPSTTTPAAGAVALAPITGTTHEVKMIGDATGYKYVPATITIKSGDGIKYVMVSGGPHNVAFQNVTDPAVKAQLDANMPGPHMGELSSPMIMQPNEPYTVSFGKIPAGTYDFICIPHAALGMKGAVTVQ